MNRPIVFLFAAALAIFAADLARVTAERDAAVAERDLCAEFAVRPLPADLVDAIGAAHDAATVGPPTEPSPPWRCPSCGSTRWVAASLNGGLTRIAQCVPCGRYDNARAEELEARREH